MIQLKGVSFQYDQKSALHNINLEIPEGSLTVICGVTGSGKSTLMRLIAGLEKPSSGSITHTGNRNGFPSSRSMVFQQPETQLFASTVHKDIEYGLAERGIPKTERPELIQSAMAKVGLPYEIFSGRSPFLLSGGEKRRVCIAGAIAVQPGLLVLDEPTAGLDPPAARGLLEWVQELRQSGFTLVIGTHDLDSFFPVADNLIVMSQGSVHYSGPVRPLTADPGRLSAAGLEPPAYMRIGHMLKEQGLLPFVPANLKELLEELERQPLPMQGKGGGVRGHAAGLPAAANNEPHFPAVEDGSKAAIRRARWQGLDPRVKWLGMVLGSLVILLMDSLLPLLLTTGLAAVLLLSAGIPWRRTVWFFRPFLMMFLFLWLLSALSWSSPDFSLGPLGFSYQGLIKGGLSVLRFLLLITLSFLFTETTTGAPLREGLEWAFAPLKKLGVRTRNGSLAVSITLQFVPWILGKLSQLQLALKSRGRQKSGLKRWTPRQISLLIVPLLILVISMGDELATAIESRGYDSNKERSPSYTLAWRRRDTLALVYIILAAAILWGCSRIA